MRVTQNSSSFYKGEEENYGDQTEVSDIAEDQEDMTTGWFSMNRDDGGPSYHSKLPSTYAAALFTSDTALSCLIFIIPLIAFVILLPSFRKKHLSSIIVVILCLLSGLGTSCAYVSSSWVTGETEVEMPLTPKGRPIKSLVGFWAGLWHAKLTYVTEEIHIVKCVKWGSRAELTKIHKSALREGWPLALVSLTAEMSGEGLAWHGVFGDALKYAGTMTSYILMAALYSWAVWFVILISCPELSCRPLIITGILTAITSLTYLICALYYFPEYVLVDGKTIKLRLSWAWWLICCMSVVLAIFGGVLTVYENMYPGKLGAMFKLDFYTHTEDLSGAPELLYAYDNATETYSHMCPLSTSSFWYDKEGTSIEHLLTKDDENKNLVCDNDCKSEFSEEFDSKKILTNDKKDLVQYVDETEVENEAKFGSCDEIRTSFQIDEDSEACLVPAVLKKDSDHVTKAEELATVRRRTPPEKSRFDGTAAEPEEDDRYKFATIRKGKSIPRQFSAPVVVPQTIPRPDGRLFRKSISKVGSKFRPAYSPRKPSTINLLPIPTLDMVELDDDVSS